MKQIQFEKVTLNDNQERQKIGYQKKKEKNITKKNTFPTPSQMHQVHKPTNHPQSHPKLMRHQF
jgi:hypothetical protein